jgi:hypothetical protein
MFPTATANDWKGSGPTVIRKDGKNRQNDRLDYALEEKSGTLNPAWVSLLMAFPPLLPDGRMLHPSEWLNTILSRQDSTESSPTEPNG